MCVSGDGRLPVPSSTKQDVLNATRLYSGNDSDFMEITTCVGGLEADDTAVEPDSLILSPALEQENNVGLNRAECEACLVDVHNKSVRREDDVEDADVSDVSLTSCVGTGVVISSEFPLSVSVCASYAPTTVRGLNKTVLFGDDDMEMTRCVPLDVSTKVDDDVTQCLPMDESAATKSSCRWPFGKRQDRKERVSSYEDNLMSESMSLGDKRPFVEYDDLHVSEKVDTAAFLLELNAVEKTAQAGEFDLALHQMHETSFPFAVSASIATCPVTAASSTDGAVMDTHPESVDERGLEYSPNEITEVDITDNHRQLVNSSSSSAAAAEHETVKSDVNVVAFSDVNTSKILTTSEKSVVKQQESRSTAFLTDSFVETGDNQTVVFDASSVVTSSDVNTSKTLTSSVKSAVNQQESISTDFLTDSFVETGDIQTSAFDAFSNLLPSTATTCSMPNDVTLSSTVISSSYLPVVDQTVGYRYQAKKSSAEEAEQLSAQSAEETLKARPVRFGADALMSIFTKTESESNNLAVFENTSLTAAIADNAQATDLQKSCEIKDLGFPAFTGVTDTDISGLRTSVNYDQIVSSQSEARKPAKNAAGNTVQSADDILTSVRLASSMSYQTTSTFQKDNVAARAHQSFRLANSAVKLNPTSAYGPANKSLTSSLHRYSSTGHAFQRYGHDLDRTTELARSRDITARPDVSGNSSRMNISAAHMELTDTLPTNIFSFSLESVDVTKRDEMHLEPIRDEMHLQPIRDEKSLRSESNSTSCGDNTLENFTAGKVELENLHVTKQDTLPTNLFSFRVESLNETKREEMHIEPIRDVQSLSSESYSTSSHGSCGNNNLETFTASNMEHPSSVKQSLQSGSSFTLPMMTVASDLSNFCLPTTANSTAILSDEHYRQNEITTNVKNLSLACNVTSSCGSNIDIDIETSDTCPAIELPLVVAAAKSQSESGEENLSLSAMDVSQSSVFCTSDCETCPTHNTRVPPEDAGSTSMSISMSNSKVRVGSNIFCQLL